MARREPHASDHQSSPNLAEIELLNVSIARQDQTVSAQWGLHPELKKEIPLEEWKELSDLMAKVTELVGRRFSEILSEKGSVRSGNA